MRIDITKTLPRLMMQKMRNSQDNRSSYANNLRFMQPLRPAFLIAFSIPASFLKQLELELKGRPLESVALMTEDQPHRHWVVKVEGGRHFKEGWEEFCLYHHLNVGEFLVFTYESHLLFQVSVFDPVTACERVLFPSDHLEPIPTPNGPKKTDIESNCISNTKQTTADEVQAAMANPSGQGRNPSGHVRITSYSFERKIVHLPRVFARLNGLAKRTCELRLIDGKERPWKVTLNCKKSDDQSYIYRGWKEFQFANSLKPGHVISFELLEAGRSPILKCCRVDGTL